MHQWYAWLRCLHPWTRLLILIGLPLGGIAAIGSGFSRGEWVLAAVGTGILAVWDLVRARKG